MKPFQIYDAVGKDGYPREWHETVKDLVRELAGHRCIRCGHPYQKGQHGSGEWSPCDDGCTHGGPREARGVAMHEGLQQARWRILTVHHLNGNKSDCRWWNLVALCQRCHLKIQGRVVMARVWPWEHSEWFRPYAAGYYASAYLGEDLTYEETMARIDELLALERAA
jgi:hypothetical protein